MPDVEDYISRKEIRDELDAEVKRVSSLFRFVLKYQRHFQPSGVEFSGLRQYLPSDDASRIDWKNSAGKEDLFVKQYEEELDMDIFIVFDASDTMLFGTAEKLKSEYAAVVSAALSFASIEAGINVGFGMWADGQQIFMTPQGGHDRYQRILDELTKQKNYGGSFNLENAINDVIGQIKENTAIFVVSDLIDVEGEWKSKVTLASMKFRHTMTIMVRDLRDYKLPDSGNIRFESADGMKQMVVDTGSVREKYNEEAQKQENAIEEKVEGAGSSFLKIDTRKKFSSRFAEFFDNDEGEW
ncbi:MAG: DUF58 domain-containing protein [Nanohaloarchaea archaeon]|nr:DUF58 domain-containing protein [Candidatus Nanohaloarchaea archaeon]